MKHEIKRYVIEKGLRTIVVPKASKALYVAAFGGKVAVYIAEPVGENKVEETRIYSVQGKPFKYDTKRDRFVGMSTVNLRADGYPPSMEAVAVFETVDKE